MEVTYFLKKKKNVSARLKRKAAAFAFIRVFRRDRLVYL